MHGLMDDVATQVAADFHVAAEVEMQSDEVVFAAGAVGAVVEVVAALVDRQDVAWVDDSNPGGVADVAAGAQVALFAVDGVEVEVHARD